MIRVRGLRLTFKGWIVVKILRMLPLSMQEPFLRATVLRGFEEFHEKQQAARRRARC